MRSQKNMFRNLEYYKPGIDIVMRRMNKLFDAAQARKPGNALFRVLLPEDVDFYGQLGLDTFNYDDDVDQYINLLCQRYEKSFEYRREIADDAVPTLSPVLGIGEYSAFLKGDIYFAPDTSWSRPVLDRIDGWKEFEPVGSAAWYKRFFNICEKIMQTSAGSNIPFSRGFFSPLDLAAALRGDEIYTDFFEQPDELHELLDYCATVTIAFAENLIALTRKYLKGTPYGMWYLENVINMSEDIACMISGRMYRKFAAPHTQRVINHFGRGFMHCHSRALYLVKEICRLDNVVNLWVATDPNQPRPIDHLEELLQDANGVCLSIDCQNIDEIAANYETALKHGNVSYCLPVENIAHARETLAVVNSLREKYGG